MPRLFVAVDLPEAVCRRLAAFCGGVPGARWLPVEQFHLTLRFIGEVDNGAFDDIAEALDDVHIEPFSLALSGVGHFPPRGTPRVLWVGVDDGAAAVRLHDKIETRLQRLGLEPDARRFHPHITLARLKGAPLGRTARARNLELWDPLPQGFRGFYGGSGIAAEQEDSVPALGRSPAQAGDQVGSRNATGKRCSLQSARPQ